MTTILPLENDAASKNIKKLAELLELETSKWFCEGVRYHIIRRTVE